MTGAAVILDFTGRLRRRDGPAAPPATLASVLEDLARTRDQLVGRERELERAREHAHAAWQDALAELADVRAHIGQVDRAMAILDSLER